MVTGLQGAKPLHSRVLPTADKTARFTVYSV